MVSTRRFRKPFWANCKEPDHLKSLRPITFARRVAALNSFAVNNAFGHSSVFKTASGGLRRFQIAAVAAVVLVVAGGFAAHPVYVRFKHRRAAVLALRAEVLARQGRWVEALPGVRAALELDPRSETALRLAAQYCSVAVDGAGLNYWDQVTHLGAPRVEDLEGYAELALNLGRTAIAAEQLNRLKRLGSPDARGWKLMIRLGVSDGHPEFAARTAREAIRAMPEDPDIQMLAGSLFLGNTQDVVERGEGERLLRLVAASESSMALRAASLLANAGTMSAAEARALLLRWRGRPGLTFSDRLVAAGFETKMFPERRDVVAAAVQSEAAGGDSDCRAAAAAWLTAQGMAERALVLVPTGERHAELFSRRMEALGALERWGEIEIELNQAGAPLTRALAEVVRGISAAKAQKPAEAHLHFEAALADGTHLSIPMVKLLAEESEQAGLVDVALSAWIRLAYDPTVAATASRQALRLAMAVDAPAEAIKALRRLLEIQPENSAAAADLAYLLAIAGGVDQELRERVDKAAAEETASKELLAIAAILRLQAGKPDDAMRFLEARVRPTTNDSPRVRLIAAAVYGANLQRDAARAYGATLNAAVLKTGERAFVKPWLR
jgi:tetratricopeptide (TPR) repeat protein